MKWPLVRMNPDMCLTAQDILLFYIKSLPCPDIYYLSSLGNPGGGCQVIFCCLQR